MIDLQSEYGVQTLTNMRLKQDSFKTKLHQRKSDNSLCSFLTTCFICLFIHSLHFLTLQYSSKHKATALVGERWTTALVLLQRERIPRSPYPIQVSHGTCWFCALASQKLRWFILQNCCVCDTLKHQNFEGLKTEMAKRGLEHRLHPALLGHFCFQHCCY